MMMRSRVENPPLPTDRGRQPAAQEGTGSGVSGTGKVGSTVETSSTLTNWVLMRMLSKSACDRGTPVTLKASTSSSPMKDSPPLRVKARPEDTKVPTGTSAPVSDTEATTVLEDLVRSTATAVVGKGRSRRRPTTKLTA